ncbi:MAG: tannase/feruloyl esterase family alpha/beta hydrolase, partial [Pseudohongiellaceae bacterium]
MFCNRYTSSLSFVMVLLFFSGHQSLAQNGSSFLDAANSSVNFSVADVRPQLDCDELTGFQFPELLSLNVETIAATENVPAHCRVNGVIDPEVAFQINLPDQWNRRFYMHGNGGHAGENPNSPGRARTRDIALGHGFVTASTNTGHDGQREPGASFAFNNDQKLIDYAWRAVDLTAKAAKAIADFYYDRPVSYSYWDGCSTGGRQGLMNAQRFPENFDGIIAGAPVSDFTGTTAAGFWFVGTIDEAQFQPGQIASLSEIIYNHCDRLDGIEDGLIEDPRQCTINFRQDLPLCNAGGNGQTCFTGNQISALEKLYGGMVSNGEVVYPGLPLGGEKNNGWNGAVMSDNSLPFAAAIADSTMKYMVFPQDNPGYDWHSFDFDTDMELLNELSGLLDTRNPDLSAFQSRGGKLIMYHGWADNLLVPGMTLSYYDAVMATHGEQSQDFSRLFMVPGMGHCRGGFGADQFDALTPLINWVENGV